MDSPFELLGSDHRLALAAVAVTALLLPLAVRAAAARGATGIADPVAWALAALLVVCEWSQAALRWSWGTSWQVLLPLHLCGMAVYLVAWTLVLRTPRVYEVAYFWGLAGTTQALLTPDLAHGFPHPHFILFFAVHGLIVVGVVYATLVFGLRPYPRSILRVAAITLGSAAAVFCINLLLGTNYLYLMRKPSGASLLDWLGPWPWYLLPLIAVGLLFMVLWYLPFFLLDLRRKRIRRSPRDS